jgi:hypothetical protein
MQAQGKGDPAAYPDSESIQEMLQTNEVIFCQLSLTTVEIGLLTATTNSELLAMRGEMGLLNGAPFSPVGIPKLIRGRVGVEQKLPAESTSGR